MMNNSPPEVINNNDTTSPTTATGTTTMEIQSSLLLTSSSAPSATTSQTPMVCPIARRSKSCDITHNQCLSLVSMLTNRGPPPTLPTDDSPTMSTLTRKVDGLSFSLAPRPFNFNSRKNRNELFAFSSTSSSLMYSNNNEEDLVEEAAHYTPVFRYSSANITNFKTFNDNEEENKEPNEKNKEEDFFMPSVLFLDAEDCVGKNLSSNTFPTMPMQDLSNNSNIGRNNATKCKNNNATNKTKSATTTVKKYRLKLRTNNKSLYTNKKFIRYL